MDRTLLPSHASKPPSNRGSKGLHLESSFETPAPRQVVWEFLLDPNKIATCLPDLQSLEVLSPDHFRAKVKVGIGLVKGNMDFEFHVADKVPTSSAKLVGNGRGVGSSVALQTSFALAETGTGCRVGWAAEVDVGGVMAGLGSKLLDSTSAKMVEQVVANFKTKLAVSANR
jgi:carbon monoxide dehydrogenase subunit G